MRIFNVYTRTPKLSGVLFMWALTLILGLACAPGYAQDAKYQSVFYPRGMPSKRGWDGKTRPTVYNFYSDVELPGGAASIVLFSEQMITGGSDDLFTVFLGLAERRGGVLVPRTTLDLTSNIPVRVEQPGNFHHMSGTLNRFVAAADVAAIHVNLWAVLSGSGSIGGGSDLFFGIDRSKPAFAPLLLLTGTTRFSKEGPGRYVKSDVEIYIGDVDGGSVTEVIVLPKEFGSQKLGQTPSTSETADVYKFDGKEYRSSQRIPVTAIPRGALRLKRSPEIAQTLQSG